MEINMNTQQSHEMASAVLKEGRNLGASLAGLASVESLKKEPSTRVVPFIPAGSYGSEESPYSLKPGEVRWPEGGKTAVVLAVEHPEQKPEMDWWYGMIDPPGNRVLKNIVKELRAWINRQWPEVKVWPITYHIEKGGIFLKEAARLAGLGVIGRNNLLVTPEYGSRVRLRSLIVGVDLPPTGPTDFDPCGTCDGYCLQSCPARAFDKIVLTEEQTGEKLLPGRIGNYCRANCARIMEKNEQEAVLESAPEISPEPVGIIKYCRNCEINCPIGRL